MAERGDLVTVKATIKSKAEVAEKPGSFKVELDIPSFGSKYPIPVTVTAAEAEKLPLGKTGTLVLVRENPKAKATDLSKDFNWYWGFQRVATTADAPPEEAKARPQAPKHSRTIPTFEVQLSEQAWALKQAPQGAGTGNTRERSIEKQVALKAAAEVIAACCQPGTAFEGPVAATLKAYRQFANALEETAEAKAQEVGDGG